MNQPAVQPTVVAIFGATGDLTKRKLIPALYNLFLDRQLPKKFSIIAIGRRGDLESFRRDMREAIGKYSRRGAADEVKWTEFEARIDYITAGFTEPKLFKELAEKIGAAEAEFGEPASRAYYLSIPPEIFGTVCDGLGAAGLSAQRDRDRIVIEKPFGRDLDSAESLNNQILNSFDERQIYRIDHYLGKETVQNILALRFGNVLYEPIWNRRYVDNVQITVSEDVGVEKRGGYYETSGALRDMMQNHLLQLLTLVAMEPLSSFDADEVRNKKVDVLKAVRDLDRQDPKDYAVRGQYGPGWFKGEQVPGYRQEEGVDPNSSTETYLALKLYIDNWRWQKVPFYLRTGKRMSRKLSQIVVTFNPVPHQMFPPSSTESFEPNRMIINIQPEEGIVVKFQAKEPGSGMRLRTVSMDFNYEEEFHSESREAYETLLQEIIEGDNTLFMRADQEHYAWKIVQPLLEMYESRPSTSFPNYSAGTWGPETADLLLARDGHSWYNPMPPAEKPKGGKG
jgi:glucose-6-phosphate 1-dehydrogenase